MTKTTKYVLVGIAVLIAINLLANRYFVEPLTDSFSADALCVQTYEKKDYDSALEICQQASAQSHAIKGPSISDVTLARMYFQGNGVEKDYDKALELVRPAAEADMPTAQFVLGSILHSGPTQNLDESEIWLTKAASNCHQMAATLLATGYRSEEHFGLDLGASYKWLEFLSGQNLPEDVSATIRRRAAETKLQLTSEEIASVIDEVTELNLKCES